VADALLVFSPLQEICFFVLRSPYLDQIGVAPLLRRRLIGLQRFFLCWFSKYVSSLCLLLFACCSFCLTATFTTRWPSLFALIFRWKLRFLPSFLPSVAPYLPFELSCLYEFLIRKNFRKTFSAVAYSVLLFFSLQRTRRLLSNYATPLEVFLFLS